MNRLAKCNKCGSNETNIRIWSKDKINECFNCGTIQLGELTPSKFIPYVCYICNKDITEINELDRVPVWYNIKVNSKDERHVCSFCYDIWKKEIFKHEQILREIEGKEQQNIHEEKTKERVQELDSLSKEELINKIIELEDELENEQSHDID